MNEEEKLLEWIRYLLAILAILILTLILIILRMEYILNKIFDTIKPILEPLSQK